MIDDTALSRPARHARRRRESEPRRLAAVFPEVPPEQAVDVRLPCQRNGCKRKVHVQTKPREAAIALKIKRRMADGEIPVYCEPCEEAMDAEEVARIANAERVALVEKRLDVSGIPRRWREEAWEGIEPDPDRADAIRAAQAWSLGVGSRGVLLYGDVGRGKSHIAAVAALHRAHVSPVKWINMSDLLFQLGLGMNNPQRTKAIEQLDPERTNMRLALVIDDLDKVRPTDFGIQPVYLAVNAWIEAQQPLLVTMNSGLERLADEFGGRFGEAIASRLAGYCDVFHVGGEDRRLV